MAELRRLLEQLKHLEEEVDLRIAKVQRTNDCLRRNKRILLQAHRERDTAQSAQSEDDKPLTVSEEDKAMDALPDKLEEILSLAKNIRGSGGGGAQGVEKDAERDKHTATATMASPQPVTTTTTTTRKENKSAIGKLNTAQGRARAKSVGRAITSSSSSSVASSSSSASKAMTRGRPTATVISPIPLRQFAQSNDDSSIVDQKSSKSSNVVGITESKVPSLSSRQEVLQQLLLLNQKRVLSRLKSAFACPSQHIQTQSALLQNLQKSFLPPYLPIPNSVLLDTLASLQYAMNRRNLSLRSLDRLPSLADLLLRETSSLSELLGRSSVMRISSLPSSHFSPEQFIEFLNIWYQCRLWCELYNVAIAAKPKNQEKNESSSSTWKSILNSLRAPFILPMPEPDEYLPISHDGTEKQEKQSKWLGKNLHSINTGNDLLQSQVHYWIEKYIAKGIFPLLIKDLKECAKLSNALSKTSPPRAPRKNQESSARERWINALKCFQILHSIIASNGKDHSSCVFIDRIVH